MLGITGYDNNYYEGNEKASKVPLWGQQPGAEPGTPVPPENNTIIQLSGGLQKSRAKMQLYLPLLLPPNSHGDEAGLGPANEEWENERKSPQLVFHYCPGTLEARFQASALAASYT